MKILVLEDNIERIKQFRDSFKNLTDVEQVVYCDNAQNCIELLKKEKYSLIFLDHDLGGDAFVDIQNKNTGSEVARWIEQNPLEVGQQVVIHSSNPIGAQYMKNLIKNSICIQYVWMDEIFIKTFKQL